MAKWQVARGLRNGLPNAIFFHFLNLDAEIASEFQIQPASDLKSQRFEIVAISVAILR